MSFCSNRVRWKRRDSGTACSKFPLVESSLLYLDLSLASSLVMSVDDYSQKSYIRLLRLGSHNRNSREEMDSSTRLLVRRSLLCVLSPVCFSLHADSALQWAFLRAASTHSLRLRSSCVSRSCSSSSTSAQIRRRTATPQRSSQPAFARSRTVSPPRAARLARLFQHSLSAHSRRRSARPPSFGSSSAAASLAQVRVRFFLCRTV